MLGQRIITALVLLALLIPSLVSETSWPFMALALAFIAAAAWEWGRLNGSQGQAAVALALVVGSLCVLTWIAGLASGRFFGSLWLIVSGAWIAGGLWALKAGFEGWKRVRILYRWTIGGLLLWMAWWALVQSRTVGLSFLVSVFGSVWVADVAAYFGGRAMGGPKLAPTISPGKTWSGALSGVAAVLVLGAIWMLASMTWGGLQGSLFHLLSDRWGLVFGSVALIGLTSMSVVGDLFESIVKRAAGAKDSSALLPGHGGVLDRIDALLPVFPLALALVM